jgi:ribosome-associated translation inhibitor RaiA
MTTPLNITFRNVRRTAALERAIEERFARLTRYCPSILGGRAVVARVDASHRSGTQFHVHLHVRIPGEDIVVEHQASAGAPKRALASPRATKRDLARDAVTDVGAAIQHAFAAARRRLQGRTRP